MSRIELVTECEHGPHDPMGDWEHGRGCPGGSRRVVDGPTDEMIEAATDILAEQNITTEWRPVSREWAKRTLDAAWIVLTGTPSTEMDMGPHQPAFGYSEPAELKEDR